MDGKWTRKLAREVTKDWLSCLPALKSKRPMSLGRVIGPLYIQVDLQKLRGQDRYRPWAFCSMLGLRPPIEALNCALSMQQVPADSHVASISFKFHKDHYEEAARVLETSFPFPLSGPLSYRAALECYRGFFSKFPFRMNEPGFLCPALLVAWREGTEAGMREWERIMQDLSVRLGTMERARQAYYPEHMHAVLDAIADPVAFRHRVEEMLNRPEYRGLPREDFAEE